MTVLPDVPITLDNQLLHTGEMLNQYRIEKYLGAGASGVVFCAYDLRLQRRVALKLLGGSLQADPAGWGRLLREARTASRLSHPCLCSIYEVAEERGYTYIAMEYVGGELLKSLIPPGGLPVREALQYAEQLAGALAHVHERGIIHRDIKSSNIIITPEGEAKLLDFGLATRVRRNIPGRDSTSWSSQEYPANVGGTLPYVAPEILQGERAGVQSDLWSLGVLLYEMVSGKLPFNGNTSIAVGAAILTQTVPRLPRHVSPELVAIIRHCLEKDCASRYAAATEVRADLRKAVGGIARHALRSYLGNWLARIGALGRDSTSVSCPARVVEHR